MIYRVFRKTSSNKPTKIRLDRACLPNFWAPTPSVNSTQRDGTSPNSIDDTIDRITRGDDTRVGQSSTRKIPRRNQIRMDQTGKELGDVQQAVLPVDSERYQTGIVPQKMKIQDFEEQIEFMLSKLEEAKSTTCPDGKLFSVVLRELNFIFLGQVGLDLVEKTSEKIKEMIRKAEEEQSKIPEIVIKERLESLLRLGAAHGHVDVLRF
ncbi:hypothetical protein B9Z55_028473 [Caenorhabditis nigoni]|uniref:Uncharacterized protein n=2 Tax=Caenorhabditis nigoni TaxID=1611254 RepID=A0A2G5SBR8_9PELO|nr:hypothetical protein B9Z55_028473 [Caenorhabditis nigoni]